MKKIFTSILMVIAILMATSCDNITVIEEQPSGSSEWSEIGTLDLPGNTTSPMAATYHGGNGLWIEGYEQYPLNQPEIFEQDSAGNFRSIGEININGHFTIVVNDDRQTIGFVMPGDEGDGFITYDLISPDGGLSFNPTETGIISGFDFHHPTIAKDGHLYIPVDGVLRDYGTIHETAEYNELSLPGLSYVMSAGVSPDGKTLIAEGNSREGDYIQELWVYHWVNGEWNLDECIRENTPTGDVFWANPIITELPGDQLLLVFSEVSCDDLMTTTVRYATSIN
ncbi:hypothetical protein ACFL24_01830 [Patescibacteria group bacterium]